MKSLSAATVLAIGLATTPASAQQTFKMAYLDPLSGPFAAVGELMLSHVQYGSTRSMRRAASARA